MDGNSKLLPQSLQQQTDKSSQRTILTAGNTWHQQAADSRRLTQASQSSTSWPDLHITHPSLLLRLHLLTPTARQLQHSTLATFHQHVSWYNVNHVVLCLRYISATHESFLSPSRETIKIRRHTRFKHRRPVTSHWTSICTNYEKQ